MTRLKDALDKAAREHTEDSPRSYTRPAQVVPDSWQFDENDPPVDDIGAASVAVASAAVASTVVDIAGRVVAPAISVVPVDADFDAVAAADFTAIKRAHSDQWASYPFGRHAAGKLVVGPEVDNGLVEQYRRLGAALHHHQLQTGAKTLMVTSAVPSEGKTLTATNLALTLSHSYQRRVLLIDADLRKPSVHEILHLPHAVGLSEKLRRSDRAAIRPHALTPTFAVLTAGRPDSDPMAGLVSETMNQVLLEASQQYDWVIVDTPPVALLPDANLLAAMIDTAVLVIGANSTPFPLVQRAVEAIGEQRIIGAVLNRLREPELVAGYSYYGYGKYGYGYGYGRSKPRRFKLFRKLWRRKEQATNEGIKASGTPLDVQP